MKSWVCVRALNTMAHQLSPAPSRGCWRWSLIATPGGLPFTLTIDGLAQNDCEWRLAA